MIRSLWESFLILIHCDPDQDIVNKLRRNKTPITIGSPMKFIRYISVSLRLERLGFKHAVVNKGFRGILVT